MSKRLKNVVGDFLTYAINGVFVNLIAVIALPIITRVFTVSEFGAIETIQSSAILLPAIIGLGYDIAIMKQLLLEEDPVKQRNTVFTLCISLALWGGLIIGACILFSKEIALIILKDESYSGCITLALLAIYTNIFFGLTLQLMRVEFKVKQYTIVNVGQTIFQYGLIIIFISPLDLSVEGYFSASLISSIAWTFIAFILTKKFYKGHFEPTVLKSLLSVGVPVMLSSLAYWVINFSDRILLTQFGSLAEAGYYSMSVKMIAVVTMVVTSFSKAWTPRAFQFYREKPAGYLSTTNALHVHVAVFITIIALLNIAIGRLLIMIFATEEYLSSVGVMVPLAFGAVFQCLSQFSSMGIYFKDKTKDIGKASWIAAVINVTINCLLIPFIGAIAAGLSTLLSYFFLYLYYRHKTDKYLQGYTKMAKPLLATFLGLGFGVAISAIYINNLLLDCCAKLALVAFYCLIVMVLKLVTFDDLKELISGLRG